MNTRTKVFVSGGASFVLAAIIILAATFLGFAPVGAGTLKPISSGTLSILLTDPPSIPEGVTAVYMSYSNLRVHAVGLTPNNGWVTLDSGGTIEALALVNFTQLITTTAVPSGTYDLVALDISSAQIGLQGNSYPATLSNTTLEVPFASSVTVSPSSASTALIDLQPTILNLGSTSNPQFLVSAAAEAVQVPTGQVQLATQTVGSKIPMASNSWFASFMTNISRHLTLSAASVTSHSFSLTASNTGHSTVTIKMIIVNPVLPTAVSTAAASPPMMDSAIFSVEENGTLRLVRSVGPSVIGSVQPLTTSPGFELAPGASVSFTYNGAMTSSYGVSPSFGTRVPATYYMITVLGNQILARITVKGS